MIDWSQVQQLEEDMGAEELGEVIGLFLAEVEEALAALASDPPADAAEMAARLHFLKGCALNLGFEAFAARCAEGEAAAKAGTHWPVPTSELQALYAESKALFLRDLEAHSRARVAAA